MVAHYQTYESTLFKVLILEGLQFLPSTLEWLSISYFKGLESQLLPPSLRYLFLTGSTLSGLIPMKVVSL